MERLVSLMDLPAKSDTQQFDGNEPHFTIEGEVVANNEFFDEQSVTVFPQFKGTLSSMTAFAQSGSCVKPLSENSCIIETNSTSPSCKRVRKPTQKGETYKREVLKQNKIITSSCRKKRLYSDDIGAFPASDNSSPRRTIKSTRKKRDILNKNSPLAESTTSVSTVIKDSRFDEVFGCKCCTQSMESSGEVQEQDAAQYGLDSALEIHQQTDSMVCNKCSMSFTTCQQLRQHVKKMHNVDSETVNLQCSLCNSTFTRSGSFKVHMRAHNGEKPFQCTECSAYFVQSGHLSIHKRIHTGEKPYTCQICSMKFKQISHLKTHVRIHTMDKPYKCNECEAAFAQNSSLTRHKRSHSGEKPYKCSLCSMTFVVKSNLQRHVLTHTGDKPHRCDVCPASFGQVVDLKRHKLTHSGIKPFKCELCGAQFSRKNNLKWHELTHREGAAYECDQCGIKFSTVGDLKFHKRRHNPPKPHQCLQCPASFLQEASLLNHLKIHSGQLVNNKKAKLRASSNKISKVYKCQFCDHSFVEKRSLKRHYLTKHAVNETADVAKSTEGEELPSTATASECNSNNVQGSMEPKFTFELPKSISESLSTSTSMYIADGLQPVIADKKVQSLATNVGVLHNEQPQFSQVIVQDVPVDATNVALTNGILNTGNTVIVSNPAITGTSIVIADGSHQAAPLPVGSCETRAPNDASRISVQTEPVQLLISLGPNEPARQARPAGNCPNHGSHFLTLLDPEANHWQAWCICDNAVPQFANVSVVHTASKNEQAVFVPSEVQLVDNRLMSGTIVSNIKDQTTTLQDVSAAGASNLVLVPSSGVPVIQQTGASSVSNHFLTNVNTGSGAFAAAPLVISTSEVMQPQPITLATAAPVILPG